MIERVIDKTDWPRGPWDNEPDRVEWRSEAGYPALIVRADITGALCGYVGVPPGHPAHGKHYNDIEVDAHGGLTYAGPCRGAICHVPAEGEPDDVWWLGFDTAHAGDYTPAIEATLGKLPGRELEPYNEPAPDEGWYAQRYRSIEYVKLVVERLAAQLKR